MVHIYGIIGGDVIAVAAVALVLAVVASFV